MMSVYVPCVGGDVCRVAQSYGIPTATLLKWNGIKTITGCYEGQVLVLQDPTSSSKSSGEEKKKK